MTATLATCCAASLALLAAGCACEDAVPVSAGDAKAGDGAGGGGDAEAGDGGAKPALQFDEAGLTERLAHNVFVLCDCAEDLGRAEALLPWADYLISREVDVADRIPDGRGEHAWDGRTYRAAVRWHTDPPELVIELDKAERKPPYDVQLESHGSAGDGLAFLCAFRLAAKAGDAERTQAYVDAAIRRAVHIDAWRTTDLVEILGQPMERHRYPPRVNYDADGDLAIDDFGTPADSFMGNAIADGYPFVAFFLANLYFVTRDDRWGEAARGVLVDEVTRLAPYEGDPDALAYPEGGGANPDLCRGTALAALFGAKVLGEETLVFPGAIATTLTEEELSLVETDLLPRIVRYYDRAALREALPGGGEGCFWLQTDAGGLGGIGGYAAATWGGGSAGIAATLMAVDAVLSDETSRELGVCAAEWAASRAVPDPLIGGLRWLPVEPPCAACPDPGAADAESLMTGTGTGLDGKTEQQGLSQVSMCRGVAGVMGALAQVGERLGAADVSARARLRDAVAGGVAWLRGVAAAASATDELGGYIMPWANIDRPESEPDERTPTMGGMQATPSVIQYLGYAERFLTTECDAGDEASCESRDMAREVREGLFERLVREIECQSTSDGRFYEQIRARAKDCSPVAYPWE